MSDRLLNRLFSHNILAPLPSWLSRWFGYRSAAQPKPSEKTIWFWSFVGAFCGVSVIQAVFEQAQYFVQRNVPGVVASYGASAILVFGAIESPLAQPRALFGGHFIGALVGVIITKLFLLLPTPERFEELSWLAGSLSVSVALAVMLMTHTTHPPAGATALLAATNQDVRDIGWYYLPVVLLSSTLIFLVALLNNNIQRRYPLFWYTPSPPPAPKPPPPSTVVIPNLPTGRESVDTIIIEGKKPISDIESPV